MRPITSAARMSRQSSSTGLRSHTGHDARRYSGFVVWPVLKAKNSPIGVPLFEGNFVSQYLLILDASPYRGCSAFRRRTQLVPLFGFFDVLEQFFPHCYAHL